MIQRRVHEEKNIKLLRSHTRVPVDFDWEEYLQENPVLKKKGIICEVSALRHWIKLGSRSGLSYKKTKDMPVKSQAVSSEVLSEHSSKETKILVFYLPGMYPFQENNDFWGEGFTEWTNVNKWSPFYEGHEIVTGSDEFGQYDLRSLSVRKHHTKLAKEAGIYGFVFYHYWFSQHPRKKVMYEVLEKLLEDGEPDVPFCLEWANEPWTKKWDGLEHEYLIRQEYGGENDHEEHFEYLNRFFSHKNYIKVDGKPMLCIYRIGHIDDFKTLKDSYNSFAIKAGYPGIHFVELLNHFNDRGGKFNKDSDAYAEYHPMYVNSLHGFQETARSTERAGVYDTVEKWRFLSERINVPVEKINGKPYYRGMFMGWDNSPRANGRRAGIDENNPPEEFGKYLSKQIENVKNDVENPENFLFLFAWNEWGEGAVLESSDLHKNRYIHEIRKAVTGKDDWTASNVSYTPKYIFSEDKKKNEQNVAVFLHVYYTELLEEMLKNIKKISSPFDLFVNIVEDRYTRQIDETIKSLFPKARILVSPNYGRDWGGYYRISKSIDLDDYDAIFLLHGKRTVRNGKPTRDHERKLFFDTYFGSTERFEDIVSLIRHGDSGIVAVEDKKMYEDYTKSKNTKNTKILFEKFNYEFDDSLKIEFSYGSMFVIHAAILKKILNNVYLDEFEKTENLDGLLPHSLERFPFFFCDREKIKISYIDRGNMSFLDKVIRKKILVISHDTSLTGAPMVAFRIAENLSKDPRYLVKFVTMRSDFLESLDSFKEAKFTYEAVKVKGYSYNEKVSQIVEYLKKENPDFVYINSAASFAWVDACHIRNVPHILNVLEMGSAISELKAQKQIPASPYSHRPDSVFFVSAETCEESKDLLFTDLQDYEIVHNCVDIDYVLKKMNEKEKPAVNVQGAKIDYDSDIVCSCGDGTYRKGLDIFLDLAAKNQDKQFLWVGCGIPTASTINLNGKTCSVPQNVFFTGKIANPYYHMNRSDLFVSTSREDPMPLVVIEAAAMGMHTVSFENSGGAKVITKNFGTCIPGDPNSKDLHELIKNHKFSKEKNLETARFVKKNFSVTNMIEPVIKIIQKPS